MKLQKIIEAEKEAIEFLVRAKIAKGEIVKNSEFFYGSKETASLRRQSMELTNALADLRKTNI